MKTGEVEIPNGVKSVAEQENNHVSEESQECSENALAASKDKLKDDNVIDRETTKSEEVVSEANGASGLHNQKSSRVEKAEKTTDDIITDESKSAAATEDNENTITAEQDASTEYTLEEVDSTVAETQEEEIYTTGCGDFSSTTISSISSSMTIMARGNTGSSPDSGSVGQVH